MKGRHLKMAKFIKQEWKDEMLPKINNHSIHFEYTTAQLIILNWLIFRLTEANRNYKVVSMGGSVKKITTDVNICPKCKGTGHC
jgi:hypothetical protein